MSSAFIAGIREHLPNATMTFDRYHLAAKLSEAVDQVRRTEVTTRPELKHTRWLWLKNYSNLSTTQRRELHRLVQPSAQLATARALRWREDFHAFYDQDPSYAPDYLRRWCYCYGAKRSRLQPVKDFVALVERRWDARHRVVSRISMSTNLTDANEGSTALTIHPWSGPRCSPAKNTRGRPAESRTGLARASLASSFASV